MCIFDIPSMKRYLFLILLLIASCSKDDVMKELITGTTPTTPPLYTLSERYTDINETTGYFKAQEYFEEYLTKDYLNSLMISEGFCNYFPFHKNTAILDFDGDGNKDLVAFFTSICEGEQDYGAKFGKYVFISNYRVSNMKIIVDADHRFGGGQFNVNDFDGDGRSEILFYSTEAKFNMFNPEENIGGGTNNPPLAPTLLYLENGLLKTKAVGLPGELHTGASGDIDNDGDIDFVMWHVPSKYDNVDFDFTPSVAINNGNFNFNTIDITLQSIQWYATAIDLFDVNGDSYLDLIVGWRAGTSKWNLLYPNHSNSLTGPVILYGDGTGNFNESNSVQLFETYLTSRDISASILGFGYSDYDLDGDVDIIVSTTREEPGGSFEDGTFYDNYYLLLFSNDNGTFTEVTDTDMVGSYDQSQNFPNFYFIRTIDKDRDGTFDIVPDGIANWGPIPYVNNLFWEKVGNKFIRRIN